MTTSSIVLMSDRRVAAIPVQECGEVLVDVQQPAGLYCPVELP